MISGLLTFALLAAAPDGLANLAPMSGGGMITALASAPYFNVSAAKAADDNLATGWTSGPLDDAVWLRVEWRFAVEVRRVSFRQWPEAPLNTVTPAGKYRLEVAEGDGWREVAAGDATGTATDAWVTAELAEPAHTTAVRLVFETAPGAQVAVSELRVEGPPTTLPMDYAPAWQGLWIWSEPSLYIPQRQPVQRYFRRSFEVADPAQVRECWLVAAAFDRCHLWLNNRPVLDQISYNGGDLREARVVGIEPGQLVAGENVLAAKVEDLYEVGSHGLLVELTLVDTDGQRTVIASDGQWQSQEDQGVVPDWRKPGFKGADWVPAKPQRRPDRVWHWLWNLPKPTVAPRDTLQVTGLTFDPPMLVPGQTATCHVTLTCGAKPSADYAVVLRLGQPSNWRSQDYELWGAAIAPETLHSSTWAAGGHEVELRMPVPAETPNPAPMTLLVSNPAEGAGLTTTLPGCTTDRYGLHLSVPVARGGGRRPTGNDFPQAAVANVNGAPAITIDGQPTAPILWTSSYGNYRRFDVYGSTGIKLFRPLLDGAAIAAPGEEEAYDEWWFAQVDKLMEAALSVDPEIKLLPIVHMDPNPAWLFDRPAEWFRSGRGQLMIPLAYQVPDRGQVRPTFMSQAWRRAGAEGLTRLVQHMRHQPYAPSVIGVWLFAGRAGENYWGGNELNVFFDDDGKYDCRDRATWDVGDFSMAARRTWRDFLVRRYGTDAKLQEAWRRDGVRLDDVLEPARLPSDELCDLLVWRDKPDGAGSLRDPAAPGVGTLPMDYWRCYAEAMLDTFAAWGHAIKAASDGRLIAGCYYGYAITQLWTALPGIHGHTAVDRAGATPDLDGFSSPIDYGRRRAGSATVPMNLPDSLALHDKLFVYEFDSRTFLAEHLPKTFSRRETLEVFQRDIATALCQGQGWWWYEFADGQKGAGAKEWFDDPEILKLCGQAKRLYDASLRLPDRGPASQIAVIYDGDTPNMQDLFPPTLQLNISLGNLLLWNVLPQLGAPFDLYQLSDLPKLTETGKLDEYRLVLFLNPFCLNAQQRGWIEQCQGGGRTLAWLYAPGLAQTEPCSLSADNVAKLTGIAGIKLLAESHQPTVRIEAGGHPLVAGLPAGHELAPRPYPPGATWERFGNEISPLPYVDPAATGDSSRVLGHWVIDGQARDDLGALAVRDRRDGEQGWASVYCAVPFLSPELLHNLARFAGVHLYRESGGQIVANRWFVGLHTGAEAATGALELPRKSSVYEVFAGRQVGTDVDRFEIDVPPYSTALWFLGDAAALERALRP